MTAPRMGKKRHSIWCMPSQPKEDITVGIGIRQCLQPVAYILEMFDILTNSCAGVHLFLTMEGEWS